MTSKEILYVEDALGHEAFLKNCACTTSEQLQDENLKNYMKELEKEHTETLNKLLNLL